MALAKTARRIVHLHEGPSYIAGLAPRGNRIALVEPARIDNWHEGKPLATKVGSFTIRPQAISALRALRK